jgi:hypothetical protein
MAAKDFLLSLKYRNSLPCSQSGPYFKTIGNYVADESLQYRISSLEKSYIWQPHFGPDVGLKIDLVDHNTILQDKSSQLPVDIADKKFLVGAIEQSNGKVDEEQPWWLRNTTYMENNLFKMKTDMMQAAKTQKLTDEEFDPFDPLNIERSFEVVDQTVDELSTRDTSRKVLWSAAVIPADFSSYNMSENCHSLVRFDVDPRSIAIDSDNNIGANKRRKIENCIISNIRAPKTTHAKAAKSFETSLVAPFFDDEEDTHVLSQSIKYGWVKDFNMEPQDVGVDDSFVISLRHSSDDGVAFVEFFPISTRIDMKKMNTEDSMPFECELTRR